MSTNEDPVAWLRAQAEADLALAQRLAARWVAPAGHPRAGEPVWPSPSTERLMVYHGDDPDVNAGLDLIRRWSPLDAAARAEADLAILDEHAEDEATEVRHGHWEGHGSGERWIRDEPDECPVCREEVPCRTVRLLASGYRHRAGYREEWAP